MFFFVYFPGGTGAMTTQTVPQKVRRFILSVWQKKSLELDDILK